MTNIDYLEEITKECNKTRKTVAKRTFFITIILLFISVAMYIGIPLIDDRASFEGTLMGGIFGLISFIFLIKFILLSSDKSKKIIEKCQNEIDKNLKPGETREDFFNDVNNPSFGKHCIDNCKIMVGNTFVLFEYVSLKGPFFSIIRGDNLGKFDVHYFSQNGSGTDLGVDINDKNGKFIRSFMTSPSNKDKFYKLMTALENIKKHSNGEFIPLGQALLDEDDEFVAELKENISKCDKKGVMMKCIGGILFGFFLIVASINSGTVFCYAGIALIVISIIFIVRSFIKHKK